MRDLTLLILSFMLCIVAPPLIAAEPEPQHALHSEGVRVETRVSALVGKWRHPKELGYDFDNPYRQSTPHDHNWEIEFRKDNRFEEWIEEGFGVAAHHQGTYRYDGKILWLTYPWNEQNEEALTATLLGDRLALRNYRSGWGIEFARSEEPITALHSLPPVPRSINEAVTFLSSALKANELQAMAAMREEELIKLHFGLGLSIRNGFELWKGNKKLLMSCGATHPDDASMAIIRSLWKSLQ